MNDLKLLKKDFLKKSKEKGDPGEICLFEIK